VSKRPAVDQFSPEETRKRMEVALRGARVAGHKSMDEIKAKPKGKRWQYSFDNPAKSKAKKPQK
jgi:hypothetical protein